MTRRLQLLDAESRSSGLSASVVIGRIRDGLLRDNKVLPAVLGVLALLIFAWLVAGAVIDGPGDEEQQQASNQASLAQGNDSDSGDTKTPAPGVENRDSEASYGGYEEGPKDPFRQIIPKADEGDGGDRNGQGGSRGDDEDNQDRGDRDGGSGDNGVRGGNGRDVGGGGDDEEDFIEQRSPNDPNSRNNAGQDDTGRGGAVQGGVAQGGASQGGPSQGGPSQGGAGQAGDGLFNSG